MIKTNSWMLSEGVDETDPCCLTTKEQLIELVEEIGFFPMFKGEIPCFSVEERTQRQLWNYTSHDPTKPWVWREEMVSSGTFAYGNFFGGRAGFITKEWFPLFVACRRDGYDFDSRFDDGLASRKQKQIMAVFDSHDAVSTPEIKRLSGFDRRDSKFYRAFDDLQMKTYLTVSGYTRKISKKGTPYGWSIAMYSTAEHFFGTQWVQRGYEISPQEAQRRIVQQIRRFYPDASDQGVSEILGTEPNT